MLDISRYRTRELRTLSSLSLLLQAQAHIPSFTLLVRIMALYRTRGQLLSLLLAQQWKRGSFLTQYLVCVLRCLSSVSQDTSLRYNKHTPPVHLPTISNQVGNC